MDIHNSEMKILGTYSVVSVTKDTIYILNKIIEQTF